MKYQARQALFREHAKAVLRRNGTEASRLQGLIYPDHHLPHLLFVFSLFAAAVEDHFGDELDRSRLADLMAAIRAAWPGVNWLRAEAMVRICYGEATLYLDVPQSEQYPLMWEVLERLIGSEISDADLEALLDAADEAGRKTVTEVFRSGRLFGFSEEEEDDPEVSEEPV